MARVGIQMAEVVQEVQRRLTPGQGGGQYVLLYTLYYAILGRSASTTSGQGPRSKP